VFNVPLLLAMIASTQLQVGIGKKHLFLYKRVKKNGVLHLTVNRGCNKCWCVHWVSSDHNKETNSEHGMG
jgi:hypothetical protein